MKNKEVITHIVNWLKKYSDDSRTNGFVIGVSGGIDSALTSTLCAMTGKNVICLNLPIKQHNSQYDRSVEHITWLKNKYNNVIGDEVDLTQLFETAEKTFSPEVQDFLTMANARARLRMTALYIYACNKKMLVAGTGNKVEDCGVGFFTKYGDGGVDVSPIADLMKSQVRALALELKIVDSIIQAKPTDGLWADDRSDEDQIGASYDELEGAMKFISEKGDVKNLSGRKKEVYDLFTRLNKANQHKMLPIPVCVIPKKLIGIEQ